MSKRIKFKIGDLVKYVRKGDTWFPIPSDEHTGIILEVREDLAEEDMDVIMVKVHWTSSTVATEAWEYPPIWISGTLLEVVSAT